MKKLGFVFFAATVLLLSSCSKNKGYGVVLWDDPKNGLRDCDIVPVYVKSNISPQGDMAEDADYIVEEFVKWE